MMSYYDVAIIGAGPAGLFAAHTILKQSNKATILIVDKGKAAQDRSCSGSCLSCLDHDCCNVLCGVGGGGLFSDGKLVLDLHSGGKLDSISNLSEQSRNSLIEEIIATLKRHDGLSESSKGLLTDSVQKIWQDLCHEQGLQLKHYDVLHMGTANLQHITQGFSKEIFSNPRVDVKLECEIAQVSNNINNQSVLMTTTGESFIASNVIFSVGKTGSTWMRKVFDANSIGYKHTNAYIGVRVETAHDTVSSLFEYSFDPKIWTFYGERKVKTHCFCRHGDITISNYMNYPIVGGHTRYTSNNTEIPAGQKSNRSNFNVLVSTSDNDSTILNTLNEFKRINSNGVVVQSILSFLGSHIDLKNIKSIDRARVGNIRTILDSLSGTGTLIADFLTRLGNIMPNLLGTDTLIYAPAIEWFMDSVEVTAHMETSRSGWFAVGDGAGLSQGIVHSAATAIIAAEEICKRIN